MASAGANGRCSGSNGGNAAPTMTAWRQRRWRHRQHQERTQLLPRNNSRGSVNGRNGHGRGSCSNGAAAAVMSATSASMCNNDGSHGYSAGGSNGCTSIIASAPAAPAAAAGRHERGKPLQSFSLIYIYILYILM